jgi:hypothetical protein
MTTDEVEKYFGSAEKVADFSVSPAKQFTSGETAPAG